MKVYNRKKTENSKYTLHVMTPSVAVAGRRAVNQEVHAHKKNNQEVSN